MRTSAVAVFAAFLVWGSVAAEKEQYVMPRHNKVGIYANEIRKLSERPLFKADSDARLLVLLSKPDRLKVRDSEGRIGWVEKRLVAFAQTSTLMRFKKAEVLAYLDTPQPIYILEGSAPDETPLRLDRSFRESLEENVDRETLEREAANP